jgi:uncharacterized protein (DUF433 family)
MVNWKEYIHSDPNILLGKPVIIGTRISVELILELLAEGWTQEMILDSYPNVTEQHIKAVFAYTKESVENDRFFPISS